MPQRSQPLLNFGTLRPRAISTGTSSFISSRPTTASRDLSRRSLSQTESLRDEVVSGARWMVPAPFIVVVDANVLFPLTLRDTVLRSAAAGFYQLR